MPPREMHVLVVKILQSRSQGHGFKSQTERFIVFYEIKNNDLSGIPISGNSTECTSRDEMRYSAGTSN